MVPRALTIFEDYFFFSKMLLLSVIRRSFEFVTSSADIFTSSLHQQRTFLSFCLYCACFLLQCSFIDDGSAVLLILAAGDPERLECREGGKDGPYGCCFKGRVVGGEQQEEGVMNEREL